MSRVKLNFDATIMEKLPFTEEIVRELIEDASQMIQDEQSRIAQGQNPEEWQNKNKVVT